MSKFLKIVCIYPCKHNMDGLRIIITITIITATIIIIVVIIMSILSYSFVLHGFFG